MQKITPGPPDAQGPAEAPGPSEAGRYVRGAIVRGAIVRVRRRRWRIADVRSYERCDLVTLMGLAPPDVGVERRVLTPFDSIEPIARPRRPRIVAAAVWRRACRALIAAETPPGSLRSAARARIDLLPYQLEPALAVLRGLGCRVLLADDVGLGKTVQAGLIASELLARGAIDRLLVLAPAGLREQWIAELLERFRIDATLADAHVLRRIASTLPLDVNPWSTLPIAVASVDYIKRPEALSAAAGCRWDLVIVDEAHASAADSDRHAAVHALCARASYVLLLTATPHNGDERAFDSLCGLGSVAAEHDDPLIVFRRTRQDAGLAVRRRVHTLRVRPTAHEQRMHHSLAQYSDAVRVERNRGAGASGVGRRGAGAPGVDRRGTGAPGVDHDVLLALSVLHKRALSSAWALAESVDRRLAALSHEHDGGEQLTLPLGDVNGDFTPEDDVPMWPAGVGLADAGRERRLLQSLADTARAAAAHESKLAALNRLLRRIQESVVVFTEYRDTLRHIRPAIDRPSVVLHGGLTREERAVALADFARLRGTVMLATDAAGEGLNLHHACRLVINLELPWNPMRLEQRIGRVDRIGQPRTVHAIHLIADGTGEVRILARLRDRIEEARAAIGAPDPLAIARLATDEP